MEVVERVQRVYLDSGSDYKKMNPQPTLAELATPFSKNKKDIKGLVRIKDEDEPMSPGQLREKVDKIAKQQAFQKLMLGDVPDYWWQPRKDAAIRDFLEYEVIGGDVPEDPNKKKNLAEYMKENPLRQHDIPRVEDRDEADEWRPRGKGKGWKGGRKPWQRFEGGGEYNEDVQDWQERGTRYNLEPRKPDSARQRGMPTGWSRSKIG